MWLLYFLIFLVIVAVAVMISLRSALELPDEQQASENEQPGIPKTVKQQYIDLVMKHKRHQTPMPQQKKIERW